MLLWPYTKFLVGGDFLGCDPFGLHPKCPADTPVEVAGIDPEQFKIFTTWWDEQTDPQAVTDALWET